MCTDVPVIVQEPEAVNVTGNPEVADAATVKSGSASSLVVGTVPNVIVCPAFAIENDCGTEGQRRMSRCRPETP